MNQHDIQRHNREVKEVWDAYHAGSPVRMPMITGISDRYFVLNKDTNPNNISFREYSTDMDVMFTLQCDFAEYRQFHIVGDHEMGVPSNGWTINIDFQNYYEAAWYGCETQFPSGEVPYAIPLLNDDNKNMLFHKGIPDPFGGFMATARDFYEYFMEQSAKRKIMDAPITRVDTPFAGSDGMFTMACELRGADNICIDMYEDPDYYHQLMEYLTQSIIERILAWRKYKGEPLRSEAFGFADDSILLLSKEMYREMVLPYHKKMALALSTMEKPGFVHLCGDATRHFKTIRDELNVYTFDTGFPVDHRALCEELGSEVVIQGGTSVGVITNGTLQDIEDESRRIIESVKPVSKNFIFRDGNDIPPYTSLERIQALYDACKTYGVY